VHCSFGLALHTGHCTDSIRLDVSCPIFTSRVFNVAALRDSSILLSRSIRMTQLLCCEIALIEPVPERRSRNCGAVRMKCQVFRNCLEGAELASNQRIPLHSSTLCL